MNPFHVRNVILQLHLKLRVCTSSRGNHQSQVFHHKVSRLKAPMKAYLYQCACVQVVSEILTDLGIGKFTLKLNHRRLLDAMLDLAGVPPQKFRCTKPWTTPYRTFPCNEPFPTSPRQACQHRNSGARFNITGISPVPYPPGKCATTEAQVGQICIPALSPLSCSDHVEMSMLLAYMWGFRWDFITDWSPVVQATQL